VNEVVIGTPDKDFWNNSEPVNDTTTNKFGPYVEYPTLPAIIDIIYGVSLQPTVFPRTDLVAAFLTGLAPVNAFPATPAPVPTEVIHLNTNTEGLLATLGIPSVANVKPTAYATSGAQTQNRLGAALCVTLGSIDTTKLTPYKPATSCDPFGFPNGRRPIDDVIDLALDVVEGYLLPSGAPAFTGTPTFFTDGVDQAATPFLNKFPYLNTPTPGANGNGT
jgi:hypothetical protein